MMTNDPVFDLDPGIAPFVDTLRQHGIETFESCEGEEGHSFPEPTIRFHGGRAEGFRAAWVAMTFGPLPFSKLRRVWRLVNGELTGPDWEMVFFKKAPRAERT